MIDDDDVYRKFVERCAGLDNLKILNTDRYIIIAHDGHKISVNHLTWLQIMGLMETWDIL